MTDGLTHSVLIVDKEDDILHGYVRDGKYYCLDIEFTYVVAAYDWFSSPEGYILTDAQFEGGVERLKMGHLVVNNVLAAGRIYDEEKKTMDITFDSVKNTYIRFLKNYSNFSGTSTRMEFWTVWVCNILLSIAISIAMSIISLVLKSWLMMIFQFLVFGVVGLALLIPCLSLTIRRLRDAGFEWYLILVYLVPMIGGMALLVLCGLPSKYSSTTDNTDTIDF